MTEADKPGTRSRLRWPLRFLLLAGLLVLGATTVVRDMTVLLVVFGLLMLLVGIPVGLWRRRLGRAEILAVLAGTTALFVLCVRYLYLEPMLCAQPPGYPHALSFERSGEVAERGGGSVAADDGSISIRFSAQARPEANYVPVTLSKLRSARMLADYEVGQLSSQELYVAAGYWASADASADTAMQSGRLRVWRLPVFGRSDDDFLPLGDLTGEITLPAAARVKDTRYRLLGMRPGEASDRAKTERSRYHPDRLVERVLQTGRAAASLDAPRVDYQQCRPAWWAAAGS